MSSTVKVKLDVSNLDNYATAIRKKILKKAVRAGCKPILQTVRSRVPVVTGTLKKSLSSKVDSTKGDNVVFGVIGPRSSYVKVVNGQAKKPSRYAHFVDAKDKFISSATDQLPGSISIIKDVIAQETNAILNR